MLASRCHEPNGEAACEGSRHRPWIHAALNLLPVLSMRSDSQSWRLKRSIAVLSRARHAG